MGNPGVRENWCRGEWGVKAAGPWGHSLPHPLSHSLSRRVRSGTSSVGNPPSAGELLHLDEHLVPGFLGVARVYGGDGGAPKRPGQADGTPGPGVALKALVQESHDAGGRLSLSSWMIRILYHHIILTMVQEPHCLNTSILDCSVTFTVDKDVWVHGIEVPSQVTDVPEELTVCHVIVVAVIISMFFPHHRITVIIIAVTTMEDYHHHFHPYSTIILPQMEMMEAPVEGLPIITCSGSGYNELLYAHLLDNEVPIVKIKFCFGHSNFLCSGPTTYLHTFHIESQLELNDRNHIQ